MNNIRILVPKPRRGICILHLTSNQQQHVEELSTTWFNQQPAYIIKKSDPIPIVTSNNDDSNISNSSNNRTPTLSVSY